MPRTKLSPILFENRRETGSLILGQQPSTSEPRLVLMAEPAEWTAAILKPVRGNAS